MSRLRGVGGHHGSVWTPTCRAPYSPRVTSPQGPRPAAPQLPYPGPPRQPASRRRLRGLKSKATGWGRKVWAGLVAVAVVLGGVGGFLAWALPRGDDSRDPVPPTPSAGDAKPITIDVSRWGGPSYFLNKSPAEVTPPPTDAFASRDEWLQENGGVDAGQTYVNIVVQGSSQLAVVLTGLDVEVLRRRPPPRGIWIGPSGSSGLDRRLFTINLDAPRPAARFVDNPVTPRSEPSIDFPYSVSDTDPEVFVLIASSRRCDCLWRARLRWSSGGRSGAIRIDENGKPFRTVSTRQAVDYGVRNGRIYRIPPPPPGSVPTP